MSIANLNEFFVFGCIAVITAAPFYYRYWLKRYPVRTLDSIDQVASRLSIIIFVALFAGAFVFSQNSRRVGEVLLCAAILSFSILYQSRFRYLQNQNNQAKPESPSQRAKIQKINQEELIGKLAIFLIFAGMAILVAKFPVLLLSLLFYSFLSPYLLRIKYRATVMTESSLKEDFKAIFTEAGTQVHEIYLIDSEACTRNAMMAGNTLFITIDLFEKLNDEELKAVICHEASHLQKHHAVKRLFSSVGAFTLVCFWFFLPTTLSFSGSLTAIYLSFYLSMPLVVILNNLFLGKIIRRQEWEADLGAIALGASSEALISALHTLSPRKSKTIPLSTRLVFGAFHPTTEEREAVIRNGELPQSAYFQRKKYAYAYSLLVLGYTFHVANQRAIHDMARTPAMESKAHPASITRLEVKEPGRIEP